MLLLMLLLVAFLSSASIERTVVTSHQKKICNKWHYARSALEILSQNISSCLIKVLIELLHVFILAIVALWWCRLWHQLRGGDIQRILLNRPINQTVDQSLRSFDNSFSPVLQTPFSLYYIRYCRHRHQFHQLDHLHCTGAA